MFKIKIKKTEAGIELAKREEAERFRRAEADAYLEAKSREIEERWRQEKYKMEMQRGQLKIRIVDGLSNAKTEKEKSLSFYDKLKKYLIKK